MNESIYTYRPDIPLFEVGQVVLSKKCRKAITPFASYEGLARHQAGDWGEVSAEVKRRNMLALRDRQPLESEYTAPNGVKYTISTKADRSNTYIGLKNDCPQQVS